MSASDATENENFFKKRSIESEDELTFFVGIVLLLIGREADVGHQPDLGIHPVDYVGLARGAGLLCGGNLLVHPLLILDHGNGVLVYLQRGISSGVDDRRTRQAGQDGNCRLKLEES